MDAKLLLSIYEKYENARTFKICKIRNTEILHLTVLLLSAIFVHYAFTRMLSDVGVVAQYLSTCNHGKYSNNSNYDRLAILSHF